MADIRIKDLATTATTTASDDFMAVDGVTNGTRKLSAATPAFLTSVTTPSLTAPAGIDLTLAGGSSGASLVLGQGASGATLNTAKNITALGLYSALTASNDYSVVKIGKSTSANESAAFTYIYNTTAASQYFGFGWSGIADTFGYTGNRNVLIGTTSETGLTGAGGLKINSSTAGSSGAGALVVQGGISAGNTGSAASYFGGAVTSVGAITLDATQSLNRALIIGLLAQSGGNLPYVSIKPVSTFSDFALNIENTNSTSGQGLGLRIVAGSTASDFPLYVRDRTNATTLFSVGGTGAATFAGAVTAAVVTSTGAGYTNSGFQITNTSASRTTGFFLTNAGVTSIRDVTGVFDLFTITTSGNASFSGTISPQQATTAAAPAYVKGAIYFDTTLNKLRVGGATAWETITSV